MQSSNVQPTKTAGIVRDSSNVIQELNGHSEVLKNISSGRCWFGLGWLDD